MRKSKYLTVLALGLLLGPMALSAFAGDSRGIEFTEVKDSWKPYVPCLNEEVFDSFVFRLAYHEFETPSGNVHIVGIWKVTSYWTGVNSGWEWIGRGNSPGAENYKLDKGEVVQFVSNYLYKPLSSGAPRVKVQFRLKLTVNANGELVVDRFDESFRCLGSNE